MTRHDEPSKAERVAAAVAKAVGAGRPVELETVDFSDPNRPKTCLEVDFPILPINQIAAIEGTGKPIYQMSKWWARRRSSVFRAMLLAAASKAPDDASQADKRVWDAYYANHQKRGAFKHLKVADLFMGGGTTIVEGSRLGMQMTGVDLNPVAWLIVKNEMAAARVEKAEVQALLDDLERDVKPQLMPFYACDCPRGHRGKWVQVASGRAADPKAGFDPLALTPEQRARYRYEGPEIIYVFWAKHGPCHVTGCGHRTPLLSSPVMAVKELTVKAWHRDCPTCGTAFEVEENARMAPGVPLVVSPSEQPFAAMDVHGFATCPSCGRRDQFGRGSTSSLGKPERKKVSLTLLVHPSWLAGARGADPEGKPYGGSVTDDAESTARWNRARAANLRLLEVRGTLPPEVTCPETGVTFSTSDGTIPKSAHFTCGACGTAQPIVTSMERSGKSAPVSVMAIQGYCPECDRAGWPYGGRFFGPVADPAPFDTAHREWDARKDADLAAFWPRSEIPFGHMTHQRQPLPQHGFLRWSDMFNPRQLLVHAQLLRATVETGGEDHAWEARELVLGAFQQYLRNQNMFAFWNPQGDKLEPMFSNANFHPKSTVVENCVFPSFGRGNWTSCSESLAETTDWSAFPYETAHNDYLARVVPAEKANLTGKGTKIPTCDPLLPNATLSCGSSTDLAHVPGASYDLVVTDPPFGGLLHYSELSDFFYVWLRLGLKDRYPAEFGPEYTPKTLEAVANRAREGEDADAYYQRLLTQCWREAHRILKPGGMLTFTFHHSEDAPWVSVLESLFDAGFTLEATYPIRSDETKGAGEFGSKTIEFDIIHVCRKRLGEPEPTSWPAMRRAVLDEVRRLKWLLEHHRSEGLPEADLQVIRRGKALEFFSRHYGRVYVDEGRSISVEEALAGINQILEEDAGGVVDVPPFEAEPLTRQLLRLFDGRASLDRDQVQKYLKGSGFAPSDLEAVGWVREDKKMFHLVPASELASLWYGRQRKGMVRDYDQAMFLVGACLGGSGIAANDTLLNPNFRPHPALAPVVRWLTLRGPDAATKNAAAVALSLVLAAEKKAPTKPEQIKLM